MAQITDAADAWSAGTLLSADQVWQCTSGRVYVTTDPSPAAGIGGIILGQNESIRFSNGLTVKYRRVYPGDPTIIESCTV